MDKACKKCGETKRLTEFHRANGTRDGHRGECKSCHAAAKRLWYQANSDAVKAKVKRWQRENRDRHNASQQARRQDPARKRRERTAYLQRKYGITIEKYEEMLDAQAGVCAICGREPNPNISLHVDHDHETGQIRDLTCFRCNQALGAFSEDPFLLRAAADYLDRHDPDAKATRAQVLARVAALPPPAWKRSA
jgi:hypothetical protein